MEDNINNRDLVYDDRDPRIIRWIKSTIRPTITYTMLYLYVQSFLHKSKYTDIQFDSINVIMVIIIVFWFGEKLIKNAGILEIIKNLYNKNNIDIKKKG